LIFCGVLTLRFRNSLIHMNTLQILFLFVIGALAQKFPMRTVPLEINSFFYGYDGCVSVDPSFLTNMNQVLDQYEVATVRQCTTALVPNPQNPLTGPPVLVARGTNANVIATRCGANPATWTYRDLDASPASFPYPIVAGAEPENFLVSLNDGTSANPVCVNAFPADENNEMKTFVMLGQDWGDGNGMTRHQTKLKSSAMSSST